MVTQQLHFKKNPIYCAYQIVCKIHNIYITQMYKGKVLLVILIPYSKRSNRLLNFLFDWHVQGKIGTYKLQV